MFSRISKKKILELFLENGRCISGSLIFKIYTYICQLEETKLDFSSELKKKIFSSLVYMDKKWKKY
jgi:hypothetical protein